MTIGIVAVLFNILQQVGASPDLTGNTVVADIFLYVMECRQ